MHGSVLPDTLQAPDAVCCSTQATMQPSGQSTDPGALLHFSRGSPGCLKLTEPNSECKTEATGRLNASHNPHLQSWGQQGDSLLDFTVSDISVDFTFREISVA